ncbi:MAG: hypothetical protein ACOCX3_02710 [Chloroflexota bacterium]
MTKFRPSRRELLQLLGASGGMLALPGIVHRVSGQQLMRHHQIQSIDQNAVLELEMRLLEIIGSDALGLDLRRIDPETGQHDFRILNNAYLCYPVASCFKAMVVFYYFVITPRAQWRYDEDSPAYRVAVFSNNPLTGELIAETAQFYPGRGNAIEKFNEFVRFTLFSQNGLYSWDWQGSPTIGQVDLAYAPSPARAVRFGEVGYEMDNVFFPADLAEFWSLMLRPDPVPGEPQAADAVTRTLELFAIAAEGYRTPIERARGSYIGKDGVIPEADSPVGRVTNDAGIVYINDTPYVISAMFTGSEFRFVRLLRNILAEIELFEESL